MNAPETFDIHDMPSDADGSDAGSPEARSWVPAQWPSDNFASPIPVQKRAIGWRGGLRGH